MYSKLVTLIVAAILALSTAGSACAAFADLELIRVYYDRNGSEYATDLGKVKDLLAAGTTTIGGDFGSLTTGYAVYFALDRATTANDLWVTGSTTTPSTISGGGLGLTNLKSGATTMYTLYNSQGGTEYTGQASASSSYKTKVSATQGLMAGSISSTSRLNTEASIATLIEAGTGSVTQILYFWDKATSTLAADKIGVPVATITTHFDGKTVISPPPPVTFVPDAPTGVAATAADDGLAEVTFSPPASDGGSPITGYSVTSTPDGKNGTGAGSPITVSGLTNGTAYTFTVKAINAKGASADSPPSNSVTPMAAVTTYTVSASAPGGNGTITPASDTVNSGTNATLTIAPATGYSLTTLTDNGTDVLGNVAGGIYTIADVTADHDVVATFAIGTYSVTASVTGGNGTLTPATGTVTHGGSVTLTVTSAADYHLATLTDNGVDVTASVISESYPFDGGSFTISGSAVTSGSYTITGVTANHDVVATFAIGSYSVTASVTGGNGTLAPASGTVVHGGSVVLTVAPAANHHLATLTDNGTDVFGNVADGIYTITDATADHDVVATFTIDTYSVTASVTGGNGTLTAASGTVNHGGSVALTVAPAANHHLATLTDNGTNVFGNVMDGIYTITDATADHDVVATFAIDTYAVTASVTGGNGTLTAASGTVNHGGSVSLTVAPAANHHLATLTDNGANVLGSVVDGIYTITDVTANHDVVATFAIDGHTVIPSVGIGAGHGSITPATPQGVDHDGMLTFTVTPDATYTATVTGTCGGTLEGTTFTTLPVTEDCTVTANFSQNNHTVSAFAGANGSISPATKLVAEGATVSLTVTPAMGYNIASVSGTCGGTLSGETFTTAPVTADCTVDATFAIQTRTVTATATGGNGSVTPATSTVDYGGNLTLTISPAANYHLATLTDNGNDVTGSVVNGTYNVTGVTENKSVIATFAIDTRTVTATVSGGNGAITPTTSTVNHGGSATVTVTPATGYRLASLADNGNDVTSQVFGGSYTIASVTAGHNLVATFAIDTRTVTASVTGGNGSVTPGTSTLNYGGSVILTIAPAANHHLATLTDNGTDVLGSVANGTYTITGVTTDRNVVATFAIDTRSVTATVSGGNGTITPASSTVSYGSSITLTVTPATGHHLATLTDNGTSVIDAVIDGSYTIAGVNANRNVVATFAPDIKNVTATVSGGNGTVTPASSQVAYGGSTTLSLTPATGYRLATLTDNAADVTAQVIGGSYTVSGVTADRSIVATFAVETRAVTATVIGGNGSITPASGSVDYGATAVLSITPAANHHLASLTDNGADVLGSVVNGSYTITGTTVVHTVVATFAVDTRTVTARVSGSNGAINPAEGSIGYGGSATLAVTPAAGYHLASLTDNGSDVTAVAMSGSYSITDVREDHEVVATFRGITFAVSPTAGPNGGIAPATSQTVDAGKSFSFTVTPDAGYQIAGVTGCGGTLSGDTYTTAGAVGNCTVSATFVAIPILKGDLDGSGKVDIADALLALQLSVGLKVMTPAHLAAGDVAPIVNQKSAPDNKLDIADAVALLRRSVGALIW